MIHSAAIQIEKLTDDQWRERIKANKVYQSMLAVNEIARQVAQGARASAIVSGPTGVGKTWAFEQAFSRRGIKFQVAKPASEPALIELLAASPRGVFLFDECDHMLTNIGMLNTLKKITDTKPGDKILTYNCRSEKLEIPQFKFKGRLVILTNTPINSRKILNDKRIGHHIRALNDRCEPFDMSFDHRDVWEYSCYLAVCEKMLHVQGHDRETTNIALRYFTETIWRRDSVSPRALGQLAKQIKRSPDKWRSLVGPMLLDKPHTAAPVPAIPQLPDPRPRATLALKGES